jgi:hypothetical protein
MRTGRQSPSPAPLKSCDLRGAGEGEQAALQQQINEAAGCNPAGMGGVNAAIEQRARPQQGDWHYFVRNWFEARVDFLIRRQFPDQEILHFEENNCHFLRMSDFPTQENGKN